MKFWLSIVFVSIISAGSFFWWKIQTIPPIFPAIEYAALSTSTAVAAAVAPPAPLPPKHIKTPKPVRGIYMTSWVAGTPSIRQKVVKLIRDTEVNAVVIDVKDYSGKVAFNTSDAYIDKLGSEEVRIRDLREFIEALHQEDIYVIARISVFQDPHFAKKFPHLAVQRKDGAIWKDRKGLSWVDPSSREMWDYIVAVGNASEQLGFDELNFDYVRFPSDGDTSNMVFPVGQGTRPKSDVIEEFFAYLDTHLESTGIPISVDLFGFTTSNTDDLNIGQILEKAAPHVDYIAPMVYPSHYPDNYNGFANPAAHPYEIVHKAMADAVRRLMAASSTPDKLRPWLQDFDLGATYTAEMIQKEHQAVYDAGLDSWMMWDPKNVYTKEAYK